MVIWQSISQFLNAGGVVLTAIAVLLLVMWTLAFERWMFLTRHVRTEVDQFVAQWQQREERNSTRSMQIREAWLSQLSLRVNQYLGIIQALAAIAPLLGLLGTVTGMIGVFDALSFGADGGGGSSRAMAAGVSRATIPTMAGMVAALSGLLVHRFLSRLAQGHQQTLANRLKVEG